MENFGIRFTPARLPGYLVQAPVLFDVRMYFEIGMVLSAYMLYATRVFDTWLAIERTHWFIWHFGFLIYDASVYRLISNRTDNGKHVLIPAIQEYAHRTQTNLGLIVDITALAMHYQDIVNDKYLGVSDIAWAELGYLIIALLLTASRRLWMHPNFGQQGTMIPEGAIDGSATNQKTSDNAMLAAPPSKTHAKIPFVAQNNYVRRSAPVIVKQAEYGEGGSRNPFL